LNTVALGEAASVLALITAIILTLGVLSGVIPRPELRPGVAAGTALAGGVLMGVTEIVVINGLSDGATHSPAFSARSAIKPIRSTLWVRKQVSGWRWWYSWWLGR